MFATVHVKGQPALSLLQDCVPAGSMPFKADVSCDGAMVPALQPAVRWLVALLGTEIAVTLPASEPVVQSGRCSRGHRLHPGCRDGECR